MNEILNSLIKEFIVKETFMKCSTCGCDLIGEKLCTQCNTKAEIPSHKFRVEYKDFKVSEMLEIKHEKYEPIEKKK